MRQTKFTFLLLAIPVVIMASLLASCSEEGIMEPPTVSNSADKGSLEIPQGPINSITTDFLKDLNDDFSDTEWDTLDLVFDLKGDSVSAGPLNRKITMTVRAENDSLFVLSGPQMHTLKVLVAATPQVGSAPTTTTGNCTLYQFSNLPNIRGVFINFSLPMDGPDDMFFANSYWILGLETYSRPQPFLTTSEFGNFFYNFDLPDCVDRPDHLNRKVLDPGLPGEIN